MPFRGKVALPRFMKVQPTDETSKLHWGRPAVVFALSFALAVALWWIEERSHRGRLALETQVTAEQVARRLSDWMEDRLALSSFLAENWAGEYASDDAHFERDAGEFIRRFPGFQAINWIDPEQVIRVVVPSERNASALNANLRAHPSAEVRDALDRAGRERRLVRTPARIELLQGGRGFATYRPIFSDDGQLLGYVNAVFRVNELIDTCLGRLQVNQRFQFAIREANGELVYPVDASPDFLGGPGVAVQSVDVADLPWRFYLAPSPAYVLQQRFAAHHLILPVGLLVALLLSGFERRLIQRKRALESSQQQFQDLFEQAPVAYFSVGSDAVIERANRVAEVITGRAQDRLVGASLYDLLPEDSEPRTRARLCFDAVQRGERVRGEELPLLRADGVVIRTVLYVDGVYDERGSFVMFRIAAVDMTERHEAEEARLRLSAAIDQAEEGVVIAGVRGEILYVNPAAGVSATDGSLGDFLRANGADPESILEVEGAVAGALPWRGSGLIDGRNGRPTHVVASLSPVRDPNGAVTSFVYIQRDITHEAELQSQLQQAHKLEAVGRLAGGIAHDFNNILQSLLGYATLARRNTANPGEVTVCLDEIERASHRAANLVSHILAFGRQAAVDRRPMLLRPVIEEVAALVRGSLPEGIRLGVVFGDLQHEVCADPTQIHQVLMNLASNALHALRAGGSLDIRYEAVDVSESDLQRWPLLQPGPHMRLRVRDSGVGMDGKTLERIFDPYFSTREIGTGTGLGLATVHGIVENHKGVIFAESSPGNGATFTILLPASPGAVPVAGPAETGKAVATSEEESAAKLRVLYADDEAQIVDSMRRILERFGFHVSGYTSSRAALEALRNAPASFDILVTDLTMPEMNGIELAGAILEIRPDLPVVFCSGYGDTFEQTMAENADPRRVFLRKPVSARTLSEEIKRLASLAGLNT
ncbi:MAG: PAS domain S-box protein [Candidatus Hydrogenedentes bacterium]|nr:PAS domain S-box protein [Candidatus Hydrogenedentota bacterium]